MTYKVLITPTALEMLREVDHRVRGLIVKRIDGLAFDPELQGKPLTGELSGLRSLRAVGQRYRVIYRIEKVKVTVTAVAVGLRREGSRDDVYRLAEKLLRLGLA